MDTTNLPGIGIKPLLSLKRHYRAGLVVAALVILAGIPVAWIKGQSYYIAEAVFQVAPNYMKVMETDKELELQSNSQYREYVNHLSNTVTRYDVLQRAVDTLKAKGIDMKPPALTDRKFIEQLQKTIYVRAIPDTYMVRIGTEGRDKDYLDDLINAVIESFLKTTQTELIYGSADRLRVIEDTSTRLRDDIDRMEGERVALSEKLGLTTFADSTQNPYDAMLKDARDKLANARLDRLQAEAALDSFDRQKEIPTSYPGRSLLEMKLTDSSLQAMRNEVVKRSEELARTTNGLAPAHPAAKAAADELTAMHERLTTMETAFDREAYTNFRTRLVATLAQRADVEKDMQRNVVDVEGRASDFAQNFQQAMRLTAEIRKREAELTKLRDRLNYLETETRAPGFVRLVSLAKPAETPYGPGKTKLLLGALAAALLLGLAVPVALDLVNRRIRSANEAEKLMGIASAGWQVRTEDLPTRLFADEQNRRFASALLRNRAKGERSAFAFTAVKPGGGVTTQILETARVLQELGAKVLVVEANTLNPFAGFADFTPGLTDYLGGDAPLDALARTFIYRDCPLTVVGIGGAGAGGLKRLDRLQEAVTAWSQTYEYILFDLPPVLLSADAELLIDALGQVFLVVEAEGVTIGEIGRAKRLLQKLDPEAVGLVVTKVPVFHGGGYMKDLIAETLTGARIEQVMSEPQWKLWLSLLRARFAAWRARRQR